MPFRPCPSGCGRFLSADDGHDRCLQCLGRPTCSSSSLSLHSVCASRLTGGNAYLRKARGQLCASASVPRGPSVREKYSWQWEDSGEANRSTWASPNRLQISQIVSGWSRHSPGNVSCRESASAARLSCPGMWTARSDLNCVWLQRRRWRASCDMRCDRIPPSRLIYETAAVLSGRSSLTPGPVLVLARPGLRSAPVLG